MPTVIKMAMVDNATALVINGACVIVLNAITTISADKIKSVRIAPLILSFS